MHGIKIFCSCTPTGKDVPKMLAINTVDTRRILKGLASSGLKHIVQEIAAGYQLETQKAKWAADADGPCQYCSQPDSRYYRMYECPTANDVRAPFQDTLDFFQENGRDIHNFPFLLQHPNAELVGILHQQQPEAEVEHSTLQRLLELEQQGVQLCFYTDGSLCHPESITCRYAAYSIILDTCVDDEERLQSVREWRNTGAFPHTLQKLTAARTTCVQSIYRSELFAIVRVCEMFARRCIYTDSMAAIKFFQCFSSLYHGSSSHGTTWAGRL